MLQPRTKEVCTERISSSASMAGKIIGGWAACLGLSAGAHCELAQSRPAGAAAAAAPGAAPACCAPRMAGSDPHAAVLHAPVDWPARPPHMCDLYVEGLGMMKWPQLPAQHPEELTDVPIT